MGEAVGCLQRGTRRRTGQKKGGERKLTRRQRGCDKPQKSSLGSAPVPVGKNPRPIPYFAVAGPQNERWDDGRRRREGGTHSGRQLARRRYSIGGSLWAAKCISRAWPEEYPTRSSAALRRSRIALGAVCAWYRRRFTKNPRATNGTAWPPPLVGIRRACSAIAPRLLKIGYGRPPPHPPPPARGAL